MSNWNQAIGLQPPEDDIRQPATRGSLPKERITLARNLLVLRAQALVYSWNLQQCSTARYSYLTRLLEALLKHVAINISRISIQILVFLCGILPIFNLHFVVLLCRSVFQVRLRLHPPALFDLDPHNNQC